MLMLATMIIYSLLLLKSTDRGPNEDPAPINNDRTSTAFVSSRREET
ncbi:hypothetical protein R2A130_1966 [Ahrensia sp. R2A130]|nr:hypothetical protein R2A130_1966 [Ahrensia sp. R2A130]